MPNKNDTDIVAWVKELMEAARKTELSFPANASSAVIISKTTDAADIILKDEERETLIAVLDRGKGIKRGFEFNAKFLDHLEFGFKIPPAKETMVVHKVKKNIRNK